MKSMMIARPSTLGYSIPNTPLILKLLISAYREKHGPKKIAGYLVCSILEEKCKRGKMRGQEC